LVWLFTWSAMAALASRRDPRTSIRAMCAYLMLRDKAIKPLRAGVVRLREALNRTLGRAPA